MKKLISLIFLSTAIVPSLDAATLVPSLQVQMQRQSIVDQQAKNFDIKASNQQRLAAIRAKKNQKISVPAPVLVGATSTINPSTEKLAALATPATVKAVSVNDVSVSSTTLSNHTPSRVDMDRLRATWLSWNNTLRSELGLPAYTIDTRLNSTATEWSEFSIDRGYIIHGRPGDGCVGAGNYGCYNFTSIDNWFKARGIDPVVINRAKHSENIGTRAYSCSSSDCTDIAIAAIRKTFDFYMSERSYNGPHYRSLTSPAFEKIGIGFTVDPSKGVYYLTIHYITH